MAAGAFDESTSPPILADGGVSAMERVGEEVTQDSLMDMHPMESVSDDSQPAHGSQVEMAEDVIVVRSPPRGLPVMQSSGVVATTSAASSSANLPLQPRESPSQVRFSNGWGSFSAPEVFPRRAFHAQNTSQNSTTGMFSFATPVVFSGEAAVVASTSSEMHVDSTNNMNGTPTSTSKRKRSSEKDHTPRKKWSLHEDHHELVADDGNHSEDRTDSDESHSTAGGQKKRKVKKSVAGSGVGGGVGGTGGTAASTEGVTLAGDLDRLSIESEDNLHKHTSISTSTTTTTSLTTTSSSTSVSKGNDNKMTKARKKSARFVDASDPSPTEKVDRSPPKTPKTKKSKARFEETIDEDDEDQTDAMDKSADNTSTPPQNRPIKPLPSRRRLRSPPPTPVPASAYEGEEATEEHDEHLFNVDRTDLTVEKSVSPESPEIKVDEDDDMEDLRNGNRGAFYFKPTAEERWQRSQKRQQAIKDYRSRELTEARERRRRRRGSTPSGSIGKAGGKGVGMARKRVQFAT